MVIPPAANGFNREEKERRRKESLAENEQNHLLGAKLARERGR